LFAINVFLKRELEGQVIGIELSDAKEIHDEGVEENE
jgi:hypothetical protein